MFKFSKRFKLSITTGTHGYREDVVKDISDLVSIKMVYNENMEQTFINLYDKKDLIFTINVVDRQSAIENIYNPISEFLINRDKYSGGGVLIVAYEQKGELNELQLV